MKRAKIMLTAIAVLAVVGGALAFKAKTFDHASIYCKNGNACNIVQFTFTKPTPVTTPSNDPCAQTYFYSESGCNTSFLETQNTVYETIDL